MRYPLLLIHGIGYEDGGRTYWGRIPDTLRAAGCRVYFGGQDAYGPVRDNAEQLMERIDRICRFERCEKVNLLAHSKGGLEARYLISCLDEEKRAASLTTIATPHRGVPALDDFREERPLLLKTMTGLFGTLLRFGGGEGAPGREDYDRLTADYLSVFNEFVPEREDVYYQSWACDMGSPDTDPAFSLFYRINSEAYGKNDGLIPVDSARWGHFRGVYEGISHSQVCDGRVGAKRDPEGKLPAFYLAIAEELSEMGF